MLPAKPVPRSPRGPTAQAPRGSRLRRPYAGLEETSDREQLYARLARLRTVVPVFAHELASARRQAASLRMENSWLHEQVSQLQRANAHTADAQRHGASVELTEHQSARIESLPEQCTVVGAQDGCPLIRLDGHHVALLRSDGRLAWARRGMRPATPYLEVGSA